MNPTILCVDDDRHLCDILGKALTSEGYRVHLAHDGDAALAQLTSDPPDLALLDLLLPKHDGFAVLETLRALEKPMSDVPVILISGCSQTLAYRQRAERLGAKEILTKPVPLETLLDTIAKNLTGIASAPSVAKRSSVRPCGDALLLSGTLEELPFPALLHHLHGLRATGVLQLSSGKRKKSVQFRDGYPVAVRSNLLNECLGNYLVRTGRIDRRALVESRERMRRGEGLQGEILVAMNTLSEGELSRGLRAQGREKLFEIFRWKRGRFEFTRKGHLQRANALSLDQSPADMILEGVGLGVPLERVDAFLRDNAELFVAQGKSPFYRFQEIHLEPDQVELLRGLDGSRRLGEFLGEREQTRRTLCALLVTEMLELRARSHRPTGAAPRRPADKQDAEPRERGSLADARLRAELTATAERLRGRNFFEILGVAQDASDAKIRQAHDQLATRVHPDRFKAASEPVKRLAEDIFTRVAEAYETLCDSKRRTEYALELRKGAREQAEIDEGQRALRAEVLFQKGEARLESKDYLGALECFHQAVRAYPEEGEYRAYQGWALYLSRPEELLQAIVLVREGIKLAPDREKPYLFLGRLVKAKGRADVAERLFARAIQIKPNCVEALRELRLVRMRQKKRRRKGFLERLIRNVRPAGRG